MYLEDKRPIFRKQKARSNPIRMLILVVLILIGLFLYQGYSMGEIQPLLQPTPTPTRTSDNYAMEGETYFIAGNLNEAVNSYQKALELDPLNAEIWAELARIQAYSSSTLTTDAQRIARLDEARISADRAVEADPENSNAHAIRAFVLDWAAGSALDADTKNNLLLEAEREVIQALTLDNQNTLALAYYAEIQVDQLLIVQAQQNIEEALQRNEDLMDVYRVRAYVLENLGYYGDAIDSYLEAARITPNLTFLYIRVGVNFRQLKQYELALEYFAKAAEINEQNKVQDPLPYLAIGKTYSQMGEFYIASRNVEKVLEFDPANPDIYGTLGIIYFKARNYESSIPALKCATYGCSAEESCEVRYCDPETDPDIVIPPSQLTDTTVVYYYTYGSVLAGMHRPGEEYCQTAVGVLKDVRQAYSQEPVIMSIIEPSEEICASFGYR
ncbi:MAG: tetratricopeptide repeat protein [Anaerolineaceae bacterium]|nr:tetratricopeptide repeat protein [Anaerolineaceae bacterium]